MTTSSAANREHTWVWRARVAAGGLAYAASPTFALMALIAAGDASPAMPCSSGPGILPIDGMTAMYLLMGLFHLPPWLKLASTAGRRSNR